MTAHVCDGLPCRVCTARGMPVGVLDLTSVLDRGSSRGQQPQPEAATDGQSHRLSAVQLQAPGSGGGGESPATEPAPAPHNCSRAGCDDPMRMLDAFYGGGEVLVIDGKNHLPEAESPRSELVDWIGARSRSLEPMPSFADDDPYGSCACGCGAEATELRVCVTLPGEEALAVDLVHLHRWVVKRLEEEAE